jgi:ubiquinone/menaquinone biosynthesis C-methylase UbiE
MSDVCPWWHAFAFDNQLRRLFLRPEKVFAPYVQPGMTAMDAGCGMGVNAIALARMVGPTGRVIAVDVQARMLDVLRKRARKAGVFDRIDARQCEPDSLGVDGQVDFAVAFWVVHETPDITSFLAQVRSCLTPTSKFFVAEPKAHVSADEFSGTLAIAERIGLRVHSQPPIRFSRAAVLERCERGMED